MSWYTTEPLHVLKDTWDAPFFYQDSRHAFYVTTTEKPVRISDHWQYAVQVDPGVKQVAKMPPLVVKIEREDQVKPKLWGDGRPIGPDPGVIDPAPIQRLVTEDAYIRQAIGTTGVVMYGDRQVGPSGAVRSVNVERG